MEETVPRPRRYRRRILKGLALLAGLPLAYALAALLGALIPANAGWRQPAEGITIFIRTNGVHTWIMVPKVSAETDWRGLADPAHIADRRYAGDYLAFGYGNRDFYLNTKTWADLSVPTALSAGFGRGSSLVHVDHVWSPTPDEYQKPLRITRDQYRRLAGFIRTSFVLGRDGEPILLPGRGYGPSDAFYEAAGTYNAARTCNEWTGEALRAAGVKTGIWTPFADSIMWRLPD